MTGLEYASDCIKESFGDNDTAGAESQQSGSGSSDGNDDDGNDDDGAKILLALPPVRALLTSWQTTLATHVEAFAKWGKRARAAATAAAKLIAAADMGRDTGLPQVMVPAPSHPLPSSLRPLDTATCF